MSSSPPARVEGAVICPAPDGMPGQVQLAHGGGGLLMRQLIEQVFVRGLDDVRLDTERDAALLARPPGRLAFTTDGFVVHPFEFAGGTIGSLAIHGTVNDLAVSGARPAYLSVGFVLEEGLALDALERVVRSMRDAARRAGVHVVTGDTKVVERGKGDGIYVHTSGVGHVPDGLELGPSCVAPGDAILVSGDVGRHGLAILAAREGLGFEQPIESDCAPVVEPVLGLLEGGVDVRCMRDPTRGGLATALIEIAESAGVELEVDAGSVPVREDVRAACDVLGLDPLYLACEGRFVAWVSARDVERALTILGRTDGSARCIGRVVERSGVGRVLLRTEIGTLRTLDLLGWDPLPRIC